MRSKRFLILLSLIFFIVAGYFIWMTSVNSGDCQAQIRASSSFNQNDQKSIQSNLQKAGVSLTPEEIRKGREAFEKKERSKKDKIYKMPDASEDQQAQRHENYID